MRGKNDFRALDRLCDDVCGLWRNVIRDRPEYWQGVLRYAFQHREEMSNAAEADCLFEQGARAIENNDVGTMRKCGIMLLNLLPETVRADVRRGHIASGDGGLVRVFAVEIAARPDAPTDTAAIVRLALAGR